MRIDPTHVTVEVSDINRAVRCNCQGHGRGENCVRNGAAIADVCWYPEDSALGEGTTAGDSYEDPIGPYATKRLALFVREDEAPVGCDREAEDGS
jgi:hypothetical protein